MKSIAICITVAILLAAVGIASADDRYQISARGHVDPSVEHTFITNCEISPSGHTVPNESYATYSIIRTAIGVYGIERGMGYIDTCLNRTDPPVDNLDSRLGWLEACVASR